MTKKYRLNRYDGVWPITSSGQPIATVNIASHTWDLYTGFNGAMRVFSFLAVNGPINSFSADVKDFFNYLIRQQGFPASNQYMLSECIHHISRTTIYL